MSGPVELSRAQKVAEAIVKVLQPHCKPGRIVIAGSIRRRRPFVNDIDIVLVPNDLWQLHGELVKLGPMKMSGGKISRVEVQGIQVDFYFATEKTWATLLLIRTGSAAHNIFLASRAKARGWRLAASGEGLFNEKGERVAGDPELSIFQARGLPYHEPWERD